MDEIMITLTNIIKVFLALTSKKPNHNRQNTIAGIVDAVFI